MINVTKSFLPPLEEYVAYLQGIWERGHLTNNGPLVLELEEKLKTHLGVKHLFYVNNGTIALQIAIKALEVKGEVITTPFSYVATTSSIVWENANPVFVDIDADSLTIDVNKIEEAINTNSTAILATHVFGIPCNVEAIEIIAKKHNLKVIYDAAHAFDTKYNNQSVMNYGDISTLSFHATKLFHTVEGGAIITNDDELAHRISYMRNFGHNGPENFFGIGINGKSSEFHAAMGLCIFPYIDKIIENRKFVSDAYDEFFTERNVFLKRPVVVPNTTYNYAYYAVVFENEEELFTIKKALEAKNIFPRRYFYPALNTLPYISDQTYLPISLAISERILCLPLHYEMDIDIVKQIVDLITNTLKKSRYNNIQENQTV